MEALCQANHSGRSLHLDLIKCISMLPMPFIHVASMMLVEGLNAASLTQGQIVSMFGPLHNLGPSMFLFCMGCGVVMTRHNSPSDLTQRGLKTIRMGLVLNLLRFTLYYLIKGFLLEPAVLPYAWYWLIGSDILPCAGMSILALAAARKGELTENVVLSFGLLCAAGQMLLPPIAMTGTAGSLLGNILFVEGGGSYFPLISWILFPCLGYFYQKKLPKIKHPGRFHLILGLSCASLFAASVAFLKRRGKWKKRYVFWGEMGDHMDLPTIWFTCLFGGVYLSVTYALARLLERFSLSKVISACSKRVTSFYCIHWVVLMFTYLICQLRGMRHFIRRRRDVFALGSGLLLVSALLSGCWGILRARRRD